MDGSQDSLAPVRPQWLKVSALVWRGGGQKGELGQVLPTNGKSLLKVTQAPKKLFDFIFKFFFFFFFFDYLQGPWKFLGQGSNPGHSCDPLHSCTNAGSLTHSTGLGIEPVLLQRQELCHRGNSCINVLMFL